MKKIIPLIAVCVLYTFFATAQKKILAAEAPKHIGETVTICSKVTGGRFTETSSTKSTLLDCGGAFPNQQLTIAITSGKGSGARTEVSNYTGKNVCVTGKLIDYNGKPEIIVSKPEEIQIQVVEGGGDSEIRTKDFFWFE